MSEDYLLNLDNLQDTKRLGIAIGNIAQAGDCICLNGSLGAGKTTLTQAIAIGLNVPAPCYVTSPSFAMMHEYIGRIPLYHMDFYRLRDSSGVIDSGLDEYFYLDGITVIEWAERAADILPEERIMIEINLDRDNTRNARVFSAKGVLAPRYQIMLEKFLKQK